MLSIKGVNSFLLRYKYLYDIYESILSRRQILGTGNLPQDSAPVCINIDGAPTKPSILVSPQLIGPTITTS